MFGEKERSQMLGATAHWIAAVRARESERENPLFVDPWAAALAGATGIAWIEQRTAEGVLPIALRTRFFDDFLRRVVKEEGIRQIVLMAAGFDTRAFRLAWPAGTHLYELDQAPVLASKEKALHAAGAVPTCERHAVAVDLTGAWTDALARAGFDLQAPAIWLLEGFLFYLPVEKVAALLDCTLEAAAPGSAIGFDVINSLTLTSPLTKDWVQMQAAAGAPWIGTLDDPEQFLAERGWTSTLTALGAPDTTYDRWSLGAIPATLPGVPHLWYVMGKKERR